MPHIETDHFDVHAADELRHWWFVARRDILKRVILQALPPHAGKRIVDLGCGTGATVAALSDGYQTIGFDPSERAVALAQERFRDCRFLCIRDMKEASDDIAGADLVLALDVLEHVPDDHTFLRSVVGAMKQGGRMLITVPADMRLWGPQDDAVKHFRRYDRDMLEALVRGLPATISFVTYFNTRLYPIVLLARWIGRRTGRSFGEAGTDFRLPPQPLNRLFRWIFAGEARVVATLAAGRSSRGYRRGVSLMMMLVKSAA